MLDRFLPVVKSHSCTEPGLSALLAKNPTTPIARVFPSGAKASDQAWTPSSNFSFPVATSHYFTVSLDVARVLPSAEKAMEQTLLRWPFTGTRSFPVATSHSFTSPALSSGPQPPVVEASVFPSGENATLKR